MKEWRSQAHVKWECKYYVVIVPKYRSKKFFEGLTRNHSSGPFIGAFLKPPALLVVADSEEERPHVIRPRDAVLARTPSPRAHRFPTNSRGLRLSNCLLLKALWYRLLFSTFCCRN